MEKKVNKRKNWTKKVKRSILRLLRNFVTWIKGLYNNFMNLPKKIRLIIGVWVIVILLIVIFIIAGSANNKFLNKYKEYEKTVNEAALNYVKENKIYPLEDNKLILDINALIDNNYLSSKDIDDKTCEGFAVIYVKGDVTVENEANAEFNINTYLNCDKYTTEGYSDYK